MRAFFVQRPLAGALALVAGWLAFVIAGALALSALLPEVPGYGSGVSQSLILILLAAVLLVALLAALDWWRLAGLVRPVEWRDARLLIIPAVALFLPLVGGVRPLAPDVLAVLLVGYLATGFVEEGLYRGLILGLLRPTGIWRAVLISALLFGLAHLSNVLLRGNPGLVGLQAFGSAVGGVGMAALRLRTRTIWPLILLHAFSDLFLQLGQLPIPLVSAVHETVLLVYGVLILWRRGGVPAEASPGREVAGA
jgi:membrane protease YdiL (CAAX protease family)